MKIWNRPPFNFITRFLMKLIPVYTLREFAGTFLAWPSSPQRKRTLRRYMESHDVRKLNIGCQNSILDGWLNTDVFPSRSDVLFLNAKSHFPFADCTLDYIVAEHFIEHIDYHQGHAVLRECFRVLKPGGKIRLATPDLGFIINTYNSQKSELEEQYIRFIAEIFSPAVQAAYDTLAINQWFYGWGHRFIYDFESLEYALICAGFSNVKRYKVGESDDTNLRDIERHGRMVPAEFNELETMVLEAVKLLNGRPAAGHHGHAWRL